MSAASAGSRLPRPLQLGLGVGLAALLNVALVQCILLLNRAAAARAPEVAAAYRAEVLELPPVQELEPVEDVQAVEEVEPLMLVDLDAAAPELEEVVLPELSFDLDLDLAPRASPTAVRVQSEVAVHRRPDGAARPAAARRGGPMDSDSVDQPPRELASSPEPRYPRAAQRRKIEGRVTIELLIDERGHVQAFRNTSGDALLVRAVTAVARELRFSPARHQGEAVAVWGRKTFRFQLPD